MIDRGVPLENSCDLAYSLPSLQKCKHTYGRRKLNTIHTICNKKPYIGRSGLAVACLSAVREVPGSNRVVGSCVYRKSHCALGTVPFLQCLGQLSLLPSVER